MNEDRDNKWFEDGEAYEQYVGRWSRPVAHMFLEWLCQPSDLCWVDVGCGTGVLTETILEREHPGRVIGIEPSEGFLNVARKNIDDDRAEFRIGDAQSLPLERDEADASVSGLVLNFLPDKNRALQEMSRIVRPGGTVALYVWDYSGEMQLMRFFWDAVTKLFPEDAKYDEGPQFPICKPEPLADLFRATGLLEVETRAVDAPTVFADFDDFWSPFLRGQGPAGAYCVGLAEKDRERLRQRLADTVPVSTDGTIELIARAWAARGIVPK